MSCMFHTNQAGGELVKRGIQNNGISEFQFKSFFITENRSLNFIALLFTNVISVH